MTKQTKKSKSLQQTLFPVATREQFKDVVWPEHIKSIIDELDKEFVSHGTVVPAYVLKRLFDAKDLSLSEFNEGHIQTIRMTVSLALSEFTPREKKQMPEEVKAQLRELAASKRDVAQPKQAKQPKEKKKPVYLDKDRQAELVAKYTWVVAGSFEKDPHKDGGSIAKIKCVVCGSTERKVHMADLFQAKKCLKCR